MATWNNLICHPQFERIKTIYNDLFPIEVRFVCAHWIERRMKTELNVDINHPQINDVATIFFHELIQQLKQEKQQLVRADQLSIRYRIDAAIETFIRHLLHPFAVYKQIRDTISYEGHLLGLVFESRSCLDEEAVQITQKLNILKHEILTNKEKQTYYKHEIENYKVLEYRETMTQMIEVSNVLEQERRVAVLEDYQRKKCKFIQTINACSVDLMQNLANVIVEIGSVQKLIIYNRLNKWHRDQALAGNGAPLNRNSLDEIQLWFEKLAEILWMTRCCIDATYGIKDSLPTETCDVIEQALKDVTALLKDLIESAFIVEIQPPQVLKTDVKFTATVRLLTANLGIQLSNPSVNVKVFTASRSGQKRQNRDILNNTGKLDIQPSTHHLSCTFNNMKLKKIYRDAEKKDCPFVTDKKYALVFESTFRVSDMTIKVSRKTLPVVITVHTYQEPKSWATIIWDNAFAQISREPFHVTDVVSWSHLVGALNTKFTAETNRSLTPDCFKYLYEKMFGTSDIDENRPISWTQFCRTPLPGRLFSFWDWFFSIMKLVRNHIHDAWANGFIIGFIDKQQTKEKLKHCQPGTFLVRFSDSELGGISIAWVDNSSPPSILMLQPFFGDDIRVLSLDERISDLDECTTLYPDIPKDIAFKPNYSPPIKSARNSGYVSSKLKCTTNLEANKTNCSCQQFLLDLDKYLVESS